MSNIISNIDEVLGNINIAATKVGRDPKEIKLIAVTKTKPVEDIQQALGYGVIDAGENKVQEIRDKYEVFGDKINWHMIGHLQTNKVKYIVDKVTLIHSVDSMKLAEKIDAEANKKGIIIDVLVQVNVAKEDSKFGIYVEEVIDFISEVSKLSNIRVKGLMTIAPYVDNPEENRPIFRKIKEIVIDIKSKNIDNVTMDIISMGMTNDYMIAIEEGSTMVRVGTAIFGKRNYVK